VIEIVLFGALKNYHFWWKDRSVSYLSNTFWITSFRVVWKRLWPFFYDCTG